MNVNGLAEGLLHELLEKQKQQAEILAWLVEYEAKQGRQPPKHVRQLGPKAEIPRTTALRDELFASRRLWYNGTK
jgi:hypothetical protein